MEREKSAVVQRYVNLLSNSGFKAVFGDRANKDVVMSVINMLLPEGKHVADIEYALTEHQGQLETNKEFRYDFMCKGMDGSFFIVEVQNNPEEFWFKRCVSYASRVYDRQNRRGEEYDVAPVYLIGLMGIDVKHERPELWESQFVSEYTFREKLTNELLDDTIFTRLFAACDIPRFDEAKRIQYEKDMFDERRYNGEINTARREGRTEGLEEGRAEGRVEVAMNMLAMSIDIMTISKATGLSIEEIKHLKDRDLLNL